MSSDEDARLSIETRHRSKEHNRTHLTVEEGVCLALEARQRAEEEDHTRIEAEEKELLVEE